MLSLTFCFRLYLFKFTFFFNAQGMQNNGCEFERKNFKVKNVLLLLVCFCLKIQHLGCYGFRDCFFLKKIFGFSDDEFSHRNKFQSSFVHIFKDERSRIQNVIT